jgi:molecular chaperone Hsp33
MTSAVVQGADIYGVAAVTTTLVEHARHVHDASPTVAAALGRLLTGAALMGAWLKEPTHRVALQVSGRGPVQRLVAEADGMGRVRGYAGVPTADMPSRQGKLDVGGVVGPGVLHVVKEVGGDMPTTGVVPLTSGEIAEDLTAYLVHSEQIPSAVSLGVFVRPGNVVTAAGGFLIQFHATVPDDLVDYIEHALTHVLPVTTMVQEGYQPQEMLQRALGELPLHVVRQTTPVWCCQCSRERAVRALIAMGEEELAQLIIQHEGPQVRCEYCNTEYLFQLQELEELRAQLMRHA